MNTFIRSACLLALAHALLVFSHGAEPWTDDRLAMPDGLELWFDASRQNAARGTSQLAPLAAGNTVDYLLDGSGHARHLLQHLPDQRPRFRQEFTGAFITFDGKDDSLTASHLHGAFSNITVFLVAAPRSNAGFFRAFFGLSQAGRNDYLTGLNFDLGPGATPQLSVVNAEGSGFGGALSLLSGATFPFGQWHSFALTVQAGPAGVKLFVDGQPRGSRDRKTAPLRFDEFVLGARHYSNSPEPAHTQGFFDGTMAEFLLFSRVLTFSEHDTIEKYLAAKYAKLLALPPTLGTPGAPPLLTVTNPPPVQMFLPGFTVRELPLSLPNINNVKYRSDGKLVALTYHGQIHLLTDTDGDNLEDKSDLFWGKETLRAPIGLALTPPGYARGQGVFVAAKGKVSLIVDTNRDDHADQEILVADGWKELSHGVDALGVALDRQGNVYFGLGAASFTDAYLVDKATGQSHYDLQSQRGTILKVSSDFKHREIVCTGIRFPVALAFNRAGDLFCTDQEGATWLPNGNPLDELLHIQPGRHYGFPPRHPRYLPNVIDEPSVFDYAPQHQSACGLNFNEPVDLDVEASQRLGAEANTAGTPTPPRSSVSTNSRTFGPSWWAGDALVAGYSRGKLWRTKLAKTTAGYVAQNQLIACLQVLMVDVCVSPRGDLVLATHSGQPDWGSGPNGQGKLYQVCYTTKVVPQPLFAWSASPAEIRIAFDCPLEPARLKDLTKHTTVTQGKHVFAGDRFETIRPGYQLVADQLAALRNDVPVLGASVSADGHTLTLTTPPRAAAVNYAVTLPRSIIATDVSQGRDNGLRQHATIDLLTDLNGLEAKWKSKSGHDSWQGWLPHLDFAVARAFTASSSDHARLWQQLTVPGQLTLRGQLNLWEMLQPAVQSGSKLDYDRPTESVTVLFTALTPFSLQSVSSSLHSARDGSGRHQLTLTQPTKEDQWLPIELSLATGQGEPDLQIAWFTGDDPRPRAFALRRFLLPWAMPRSEPASPETERSIPELAGGHWLRGKKIFSGETAACAKCHRLGGEGAQVGPDLSNLIHRDYASVARDIREPSAALNPDHLAYQVELIDGDVLTGVLQRDAGEELTLADATGRPVTVPRRRVKSIQPSAISLMPEGLDKVLNETQWRDLMTFLLTSPLEPAPLEAQGAPPARRRADLEQPIAAEVRALGSQSAMEIRLQIVLCAGPKDHGPGEHDYPLWQKRWSKLLALADNVTVSTAQSWPSPEQWKTADVIAFYSNNPSWKAARAQELDAFLARGGGAVFLHYAVDGHQDVEALAARIGLAWRGGQSKFRHGALDLTLHSHPLAAGLGKLNFIDESYWNLVGDEKSVDLVASGAEEGQPRPLIWTRTQGKGRVFVSILGHYTWTFDDPSFRQLILRGICWAGGRPMDSLAELATIGARIEP